MARDVDDELVEFDDSSVYGDEAREDMMDGDALSPEEEAFMRGYEEANDEGTSEEMREIDEDEDI
ncbi:MAG: hypothetical protein ABIJ08_02590 [Nanoarchaeota archaeon]